MAFWLTQKFCDCSGPIRPGCCPMGWQTVYCSSRFCQPAESRYHPIEGEACASAWALDKCRFFVLGHPDLYLAVDHKPLLAIFGKDQDLGTIVNPRLLNFKLKTMAFNFVPIHIPGKDHVVPDTLSRRNDSPAKNKSGPGVATPTIHNNVMPDYEDTCGAPSWVSQPTEAEIAACDSLEEQVRGQATYNLMSIISEDKKEVAALATRGIEAITCTSRSSLP